MDDKERYFAVLEYIEDLSVWAQNEEIFLCRSFSEIGKIITDCILEHFDEIDYPMLKHILCRSQGYTVEEYEETTDEKIHIMICEKIIGIKSFPAEEYQKLMQNCLDIGTNYNTYLCYLEEEIDHINGLIDINEANPSRSGTLIKKRDSLYSINAGNRSILKDLKKIEKEYGLLDDEIQKQYVYKGMLEYAKTNLEEAFDGTVFLMEDDTRAQELKQLAMKISTEEGDIKEYRIGFKDYIRIIEAWKNQTSSLYKPYFMVKMRKMHDDIVFFFKENFNGAYWNRTEELTSLCKERDDEIKSCDEWITLKKCQYDEYVKQIEKYISKYKVIEYIKEKIEKMYCLQERKKTLEEILLAYEDKRYIVFCNMVVMQIEGLFYDMFVDAHIQNRLDGNFDLYDKDDLRKKISKNDSEMEIQEAALYFKFYFNNIIRNKVAHGRMFCDFDEGKIIANDLLLDLQYVIHLLETHSDTNEAIEYVSYRIRWIEYTLGKENQMKTRFDRILNSLNENVLSDRHGNVGYVNSHQELYWIFNPYYDDAYAFANVTAQRDKIKSYYIAEDFWRYVLEYVKKYNDVKIKHIKLKKIFKSRIKALKEYIAKNKKDILPIICEVEKELELLQLHN